MSQMLELQIQLKTGSDLDPDDVDHIARQLCQELEEVSDVTEIRQVTATDAQVQGAKGGEVLALGAIAAAVLPQAVPALVAYLKEWLLRPGSQPVRIKMQLGEQSVEVEFDPKTTSAEEIKELAAELQSLVINNNGG